jgi:hypothetical protein
VAIEIIHHTIAEELAINDRTLQIKLKAIKTYFKD